MNNLNRALLEILACPCPEHAKVEYDSDSKELICQLCRTRFEVRDSIPIMLLSEAKPGPNGIGVAPD